MRHNNTVAGVLLLAGSIQYLLVQVICEAVYPGYSTAANYISDLGVWNQPTATAFNISITLFGTTILVSSILLKRHFCFGWTTWFFALSGAGCIMIGIFPENGYGVSALGVFHAAGAIMGFVVGGIAVLLAYTFTKRPFKQFSVVMGAVELAGATLFIFKVPLGLGIGGIERMMAYSMLLWYVAFAGYLLGDQYKE
jgi:hypothetical membrane protein